MLFLEDEEEEQNHKAEASTASLECGYFDVEQVHGIAQSLLVALATASVEKTYGDLFKSPLSVVGDVKLEMTEFLHQRCQSYASATDVGSPEMAHDLLDNFVRSKTTLLSRVSSKLISSERKEDRIENFAQELDRAGAWMVGQREMLAKTLLKCFDRNGSVRCQLKFQTSEELVQHKGTCPLRPIMCANEGCGHVLSAVHAVEHDAVCGYKLLPCEQECEALVMRSNMDKHCITVCPMKLVNCPFSQVGCTNSLPQGTVEQHCVESMGFHLNSVLQNLQKQDIAVSSLTERIQLLEKALSVSQRSEAVEIGTLALTIRQQDAKIKALEQETSRLRHDFKAVRVSSDVQQLRRELQNLQKKIENQHS